MGAWPNLTFACFLQGGGLRINGGTVTLNLCQIYDNEAYSVSVATLPCPKSQRPNGKRANPCCFVQGGGLVIVGGTVEFDSCSIYGNTVFEVSLLFPKSQRPHGKPLVAHLLSVQFGRRM